MKVLKNDIKTDLKLLIEFSCISKERVKFFEQFHKTLIAISHEATDVCIDYKEKKIGMNVVAEDSKGDFLRRWDSSVPTTEFVNLEYEKLDDFLIERIKNKNHIPNKHYSLLKTQFSHGRSLIEKLRPLERA